MVLYRNRLLAIGSQFIAILNTTIVKTFYGYSALNPISSFPYHIGPHNDMLSYIYRMSLGVCFHSASVLAKYMLASNHVGSGAVSIIALMHCILSCIKHGTEREHSPGGLHSHTGSCCGPAQSCVSYAKARHYSNIRRKYAVPGTARYAKFAKNSNIKKSDKQNQSKRCCR